MTAENVETSEYRGGVKTVESIASIKDPRVVEALGAGLRLEHVFVEARHVDEPIVNELAEGGVPGLGVSEGIAKKITDTAYLVPFIGVAELRREVTPEEGLGPFVVVRDRVVDHGNLGTIVRSAIAFGIRDLLLTEPRSDLFFPKIVDASRGTVFEARIRRTASSAAAVDELRARGFQILASSSHARNLQSVVPLERRPIALVVGNESEGVSQAVLRWADAVVQIPMTAEVESLNVGVAAGISMYELKLRLVLLMLIQHIHSILGRELGVTSFLVRKAFDAQVRQVSELGGIHFIVLMMLKVDAMMPLDRVPRETGTLSEDVDGLLEPLFRPGLIHVQREEASIVLTDAGERMLVQLWPIVERADRQLVAGFSEAETAQLQSFLERIERNCLGVLDQPR